MSTRNKLIVAAFLVAVAALSAGMMTFPTWAQFALQLIGLS